MSQLLILVVEAALIQVLLGVNMFNELDDYLRSSFSVDYWSDEGISIAASKVSGFTQSDWEELSSSIHERSESWKVRCAELLGDVENPSSIAVLMELLKSHDTEVQIAALDSISSLLSSGLQVNGHREEMVRYIDDVKSDSELVNMMLQSLLSKL